MNVLVTGGAGYIGSHVVEDLARSGYKPIVFDNFSTGHADAVPETVQLIEGDIHDVPFLKHIMGEYEIDAVLHFAASSQVGESMVNPAKYYYNNVGGTLGLIEAMRVSGVENIVFSSTAAVYGEPSSVPITEDMPLHPTNVYGRTKLMIEKMLSDYSMAYHMRYVALRYFNAAGASLMGNIGEDHRPETHLIPLTIQAALGQREAISIFGTDYDTPDGTCLRDYIHVKDLASAHLLALDHLSNGGDSRVYNLGTKNGFSVREIIDTVKKVTGRDFMVKEEKRRAGDPAKLIASSDKIMKELHWEPKHSTIEEIVSTAWRWHSGHPHGYDE
jgi:UDP-glucose 4-epimerase